MGSTPGSGKIFTESDWKTEATEMYLAYSYTKLHCEKLAWQFHEQKEINVVVINPGVVLGPTAGSMLYETTEMIGNIETGKSSRFALLNIGLQIGDVRDVSQAHISAMEKNDAKGRYICVAQYGEGYIKAPSALIRFVKEYDFNPPTLYTDLNTPFWKYVMQIVSYGLTKMAVQTFRAWKGKSFPFSNRKNTSRT